MSEQKNPRGRPLKYDFEFHPVDLFEKMSRGDCDVHIYAAWGISEETFYKWMREYPELKEAHDKGLPAWEKAWLNKGIKFMEEGNDKAYRYWNRILGVKGGEKYKENKNTPTNITNVSVNNMNVLQGKSEAELLEILTTKLEKLPVQIPQTIDVDYKVDEPKKPE